MPWVSRDYRALWEAGRDRYATLDLPAYDSRGAMIQLGESGRVFTSFGSHGRFLSRREPGRDDEALRAILASLSANASL